MTDELFAIDEDAADEEAKAIAARILSDDDPTSELRRILQETQSVGYAQVIAGRAAEIIVKYLLTDEMSISLVPLLAGRLAKFLHRARFEMALFKPHP
jgi:ABC-type branched-subunit amino acid transport system ATPase component